MDRSKYKATSINTIKDQEQEVKSTVYSLEDKDRVKYHIIKKGINKFRIYPARDEKGSFIYPKCVAWLPQEVWVDEKNRHYRNPKEEVIKEKGLKKDVKRLPIFNSKIHFDKSKKDLVEEYINFALEMLKQEISDPIKLKLKTDPITNWKKGILPQTTWVCYADSYSSSGKELGFLEVSNANKEKINDLSIREKSDEPITVDVLSDPNDGICLIVDYNPEEKEYKNYYKLSLEERQIDKFRRELVPTPLTDDELEKWEKLDSLESLLIGSFSYKDFKNQLDGLQLFDQMNNIGVFTHDNWLDICESIEKQYPQQTETEKEIEKEVNAEIKKEISNKVEETVITETGEEDEFTSLTRDELKEYLKSPEGKKLGIIVKAIYTEDQLRDIVRKAVNEPKSNVVEATKIDSGVSIKQESSVKKEETPVKKEEIHPTTTIVSDRLAQLRKNLGK